MFPILNHDILAFIQILKMLLVAFLSIQMAAAKDPDTALFKKLDGFQPCELTELKAGNHIFAVYGTVSHLKVVSHSNIHV